MKVAGRTGFTSFMLRRILALAGFVLLVFPVIAQQKQVISQQQYWLGYMTSARLSEYYSWWNDVHFVEDGFIVARTGITRHLPNRIDVTAGYAHGWLGVQ